MERRIASRLTRLFLDGFIFREAVFPIRYTAPRGSLNTFELTPGHLRRVRAWQWAQELGDPSFRSLIVSTLTQRRCRAWLGHRSGHTGIRGHRVLEIVE